MSIQTKYTFVAGEEVIFRNFDDINPSYLAYVNKIDVNYLKSKLCGKKVLITRVAKRDNIWDGYDCLEIQGFSRTFHAVLFKPVSSKMTFYEPEPEI